MISMIMVIQAAPTPVHQHAPRRGRAAAGQHAQATSRHARALTQMHAAPQQASPQNPSHAPQHALHHGPALHGQRVQTINKLEPAPIQIPAAHLQENR